MVKNVRWLYAKLGNEDFSTTGQSTVTGALSSLQSELDGKSDESHTHSVGSLPVSNNQVNSASYIPTSALLYSMSMRADGIRNVVSIAKSTLNDPNKRYESKNLGTWSSASQVDTFLSTYTHENNYEGLSLGNYVTIQDAAYNEITQWEIAGFDMEHNQMAADGTIYDNGYGICLIPRSAIDHFTQWNRNITLSGGYKSSSIHTEGNHILVSEYIGSTLGSHLVNRNVLLSNSVTSNESGSISNGYDWTTAESTLMSIGQCTGTFASHNNKYDDGEANYKLPLFNYENYWKYGDGTNNTTFFRNIYGYYDFSLYAYTVNGSSFYKYEVTGERNNRPLIYIR